ncbi:hypothetical protein [Leptolyngbya subtilissima]|uniref:hypothetical protein n=1 Tax=Leptolyngbya subtilissima TaxID=1346803 RepID=UPI0032A0FF3A
MDNTLPTRTGSRQGSLYVLKRLSNLIRKQFGNLQIVINAAFPDVSARLPLFTACE